MATRDDAVDIGLVVAAAGLEILDKPPQDGEPFLALHRDADEAIRGIDEVGAYAGVVVRVYWTPHTGPSLAGSGLTGCPELLQSLSFAITHWLDWSSSRTR